MSAPSKLFQPSQHVRDRPMLSTQYKVLSKWAVEYTCHPATAVVAAAGAGDLLQMDNLWSSLMHVLATRLSSRIEMKLQASNLSSRLAVPDVAEWQLRSCINN